MPKVVGSTIVDVPVDRLWAVVRDFNAHDQYHPIVATSLIERGYPVEDFEQQAADVSVDHPEVVEHYRQAHAIHSERSASTEDLRQAMVHYRALFQELLAGDSDRLREAR